MINFIKGKIEEFGDNYIIIECNGMGYYVNASLYTVSKFNSKDSANVKILTYMSVREDAMSLYGFYDSQEKDLFLKLIEVSGIGPKVALSILSCAKPEILVGYIKMGNLSELTKIKGIGKKTAERLVVELKDKVGNFKSDSSTVSSSEFVESLLSQSLLDENEAVLALISLGYNKAEAVKCVSKLDYTNLTTEEIILQVLKNK